MKRHAGGDVHNVVSGTVHGDVAQAGRDIRRSHDDFIEHELRRPDPDPDKVEVKRRLTRFTDAIRRAGGWVASGASVARAVGIITRWLSL